MSHIHHVLSQRKWNVGELQYLLEHDSSFINVENEEGRTPLISVIENNNCSVNIVKLLLYYGADVNQRTTKGFTALPTAVVCSRDAAVVKALLDDGADPNTQFHQRSPLCIAFECSNIDVVKLLLNAGCSLNSCRKHCSLLHCALTYAGLESSEEILKLLLERKADVNQVNKIGQTIMCFALETAVRAQHIELLLNAGASLTACPEHESAFHCATNNSFVTQLRTGVVKTLLDAGVCPYKVNSEGQTALQRSLIFTRCEFGAMKLFLDAIGADCTAILNEQNLLHHAVENRSISLDIVDIMIKKGAQLDKIDRFGDTPLHVAARCSGLSVLNLLLNKGAPLNVRNKAGSTPLVEAVKAERDYHVFKMMFLSGARIRMPPFTVLALTADCYEKDQWILTLESFKMLTKICLLENPDLDIEDWINTEIGKEPFMTIIRECANELLRMDQNYSPLLRHFLNGHSIVALNQPEPPCYILDQLLSIRPDRVFPIFFDFVAARVGALAMKTKLQEIRVYAVVKKCSLACPKCIDRDIVLNYDSVCLIAQYLSEVDLLNFILAYFKPGNR